MTAGSDSAEAAGRPQVSAFPESAGDLSSWSGFVLCAEDGSLHSGTR